jgi:hypothetical protein
MSDSIENLITQGECMQDEIYQLREWQAKATPFLKSELWRISDCLAMPTESGLGADLDAEIDRKLEEDHKILTELLGIEK